LPAFIVAGWIGASLAGWVNWPGLGSADANLRLLVALAFVLAGVLITLTFYFLAIGLRDLHQQYVHIQRTLEDETLRRLSLAAEVDLLSALRSVSRIVSDQSSLEAMLSAVVGVLDHLMASEEIIIFACSEEVEGELIPVLVKGPEQIRFLGDIGNPPDNTMANECVESRVRQRSSDGELLTSCIPLVADAEIIGALQLSTPIVGEEREERIYRAERLDEVLDDIGKHVALTLKTISLSQTARIDRLTGLANRGEFNQNIETLFKRAREHGQRLALIMVDIDHFKKFNDTHGHQTGDLVLTGVSELIRSNLRAYDTAYRYGGEEIAVITSRSGVLEAGVLAERIRKRIERARFESTDGDRLSVTISLGVAELARSTGSVEEIISEADKALYQAKRGGRNRVFVAGSEAHPITS